MAIGECDRTAIFPWYHVHYVAPGAPDLPVESRYEVQKPDFSCIRALRVAEEGDPSFSTGESILKIELCIFYYLKIPKI